MNAFLTALIVWNLVSGIFSQNLCVTPNGENGRCILFENCEPFTKIWRHRTYKTVQFVRSSHCGFQNNNKPLVCCGTVAELIDPNYNPATTQQPLTTSISPQKTTTTEAVTTQPTNPELRTSNPIPIISANVVPITTPQLFTSPILTTTLPSTRSIPERSNNFENHPNFNLLPPSGKCGKQNLIEKITNGNITDIDEYPWLAMIMYRSDGVTVPNCGGSLINNRYVLTAAHCIKGNMASVRLGEYDIRTDEDCVFQEGVKICADPHQDFEVENYTIYKDYNRKSKNKRHDIALIRLKREANITDFVRPICLPLNDERSAPGSKLFVAGWGVTENNVTSPVKLKVDVPIWSDESCQELYRLGFDVSLAPEQLCAGGGPDGKDSCTGDSGGPLMQRLPVKLGKIAYYAEGIVSTGPKPCARQATPAVYVRVGAYIQWILDTIKP